MLHKSPEIGHSSHVVTLDVRPQLLDALSALRDEHIVIQLRDANSSALVREAGNEKCRHVVMPLRL